MIWLLLHIGLFYIETKDINQNSTQDNIRDQIDYNEE